MYSFTLILVLAVVGGLIAYFGDRIGMKVGRKRLSLFGLRPKYTGIIITIFTGVFITIASIVVLSIASDDVRTALFEMKSIQEALATNQQQLSESAELIYDTEAKLQTSTEKLQEVTIQLESVNQDLAIAEAEYDGLIEQYNEVLNSFNLVRLSNVVFEADQIIIADVIQGGASATESKHKLEAIKHKADQLAMQVGAANSDGIIVDPIAMNFAALALEQQQELFIVRFVSETNTVAGEAVHAYIELIPNELLYLKNSIVAEVTVDLDYSIDIDKQILYLLEIANMNATYAGMLTRSGQAVEVLGNDFLNTIANTKNYTGEVSIHAVAAQDTFAADSPLKLNLAIVQD